MTRQMAHGSSIRGLRGMGAVLRLSKRCQAQSKGFSTVCPLDAPKLAKEIIAALSGVRPSQIRQNCFLFRKVVRLGIFV